MTTLASEHKTTARSMLHPNPILRRLSKAGERAVTDAATYTGIAAKTCFFLALTMIGMIAQLLVSAAFANAPVWQTFTIYDRFTVSLTMNETVIAGLVLLGGFGAEAAGHLRPQDHSRDRQPLRCQPGLCDLLPGVQGAEGF